ncbi:MAG: hypothetical protein HQL31_00985 [Planctomycetes bacterium]|nr:hypothetical protein [Planctomycetota bacterium]
MSDKVQVGCNKCDKTYTIPSDKLGARIRCTSCGEVFEAVDNSGGKPQKNKPRLGSGTSSRLKPLSGASSGKLRKAGPSAMKPAPAAPVDSQAKSELMVKKEAEEKQRQIIAQKIEEKKKAASNDSLRLKTNRADLAEAEEERLKAENLALKAEVARKEAARREEEAKELEREEQASLERAAVKAGIEEDEAEQDEPMEEEIPEEVDVIENEAPPSDPIFDLKNKDLPSLDKEAPLPPRTIIIQRSGSDEPAIYSKEQNRIKEAELGEIDPHLLMGKIGRSGLTGRLVLSVLIHLVLITALSVGFIRLCIQYQSMDPGAVVLELKKQKDAEDKEQKRKELAIKREQLAAEQKKKEEEEAKKAAEEKKNAQATVSATPTGVENTKVMKDINEVINEVPASSGLGGIDDKL